MAADDRGRPLCELCGDAIEHARYAYRRVSGWAPMREAGGSNRIALAEFGGWAHRQCVDAEVARRKRNRQGVHDDQGAWEF